MTPFLPAGARRRRPTPRVGGRAGAAGSTLGFAFSHHRRQLQTAVTLAALACAWVPRGCSALDDGLARTPPSGWSTWYAFGGWINETAVLDSARAIKAAGLLDLGYDHINLDDAWMAPMRDKFGGLQGDPNRFPHGMRWLGDQLHEMGFKFGLYGCPGVRTCMGFPGQFEHEWDDAATLAGFGIDFWKYDNCWIQWSVADLFASKLFNSTTQTNGRSYQLNVRGLATGGEDAHPINLSRVFPTKQPVAGYAPAWDTPVDRGHGFPYIDAMQVQQHEAYRVFGEALRATGRNITYSICPLIAGCDPSAFEYYADVAHMSMNQCIQRDRTDSWESFLYHVDNAVTFGVAKAAKPGYWNDKDFLQVGHKALAGGRKQGVAGQGSGAQSYASYRSEIAIYAVMAAPLIFSADVRAGVPSEMMAVLGNQHVLRVDRDPLGVQGDRVASASTGDADVFSRPLSGGALAVAVLNRGVGNVTGGATWAQLGIPAGSAVDVLDAWTGATSRETASVSRVVGPHDTALMILTPAAGAR